MAGIIKNQLVKHLSKFTRNLKPDQISLDVLKGKTKLQIIELNEEVLSETLELPSWLRVKQAYCTGVTVCVPWMKLGSSPIQIFIDEIQVEVVLAAGTPPSDAVSALSGFGDSNSYGFIDKVVEGMSLYINTVEINFDSDAFGGSFMLQRLSVESRTPGWQVATDLKQSRIKDPTSMRTLTYKQVSWHLLRVEASAKSERNEKRATINAPLRLITSGGKIRIALKKNSSDGSVVHARILMMLEDILWVATLPQLRSAIAFYSYIMSLVKQSATDSPPIINLPSRPTDFQKDELNEATNNKFRAFDFDQTSHHLHVKKIDLHLCDDANSNSGYPPNFNIDSGAMQVTLNLVLIDIYPKTLATSDREFWLHYTAPNAFTQWIEQRLKVQLGTLSDDLDETGKIRLARCWPNLMSFNAVVRVYDLIVQGVSEMNTKKDSLQNLFTSDRASRSLPKDQYIVHFEFANFFHPMSDTLPVPAPASYLQLGPFSILFDERTLRWCLYVAHNLASAVDMPDSASLDQIPHSDIKIDLLMPKLTLPLPDPSSDRRLPHRLLVSLSTLSLCNCSPDKGNEPIFKQLSDSILTYCKGAETLGGREVFVGDAVQFNEGSYVRGECEQFWLTTSPAWIDTDHGAKTKPLPVVSDVSFTGTVTIRPDQVNVYIEPTVPVSAIIDHFQLIQLMRLSESLTKFIDLLTADQAHFANGKDTPAPTVMVLSAIQQVRAHLLLTMGPVPSPYDKCHGLSENHLSDPSSESSFSRAPTPRRVPSTTPLVQDEKKIKVAIAVEEFPEFPPRVQEFDTASFIDDSMSVTNSIDDDSNYDFEITPEDDLYPPTDLAEEAAAVDEEILNDRIYRSLIAKNGNVLHIELGNVAALVNVLNKNTIVLGKVETVGLTHDLNVTRQMAYDALKIRPGPPSTKNNEEAQATFRVYSNATVPTTFVKVNVLGLNAKLDDEIVAHLGPFFLDEQESENKVRLEVNVQNSNIEIHDRKKKKPLKIRITGCVIEQDEDARTDVEDD